MKTLVPLVLLFGALAACGGAGGAPAHRAAAPSPTVTASTRSSVPAEAPGAAAQPTLAAPPAEARHDCQSTGQHPAPSPTSASGFPGAPVTTVFIVGTVCSAATGRPLRAAAISYALQSESCAEGHQPWRCAAITITDGEGYYRIAVYDPGDYSAAVRLGGYSSGGGTVHIAGPGVVTRDWQLVPAV